MCHQFQSTIEGLALPEAFAMQRGLWHRESPDAIARLLNIELDQVQHAQYLVEQDRVRVPRALVETFFPWNQEPGFLQNARVIGLYKRMLARLRRQSNDVRLILRLPPALSPQGWLLEDACVLLGFLPDPAFDAPWTVTIRAVPADLLLDEPAKIISVVESALSRMARKIEVVGASRLETSKQGIRVAVSRSDMASAPGFGDAIQAAALVAILQYRLVCQAHVHEAGKRLTFRNPP